ncbi:MAG: hypothetical protein H0W40_19410 [Methylibium sp.]|uniref:hypothetical protein n=1 Tax=Methylibium sp. TaxID=2067992 RepID=UPI00179BCCCB|nr:hypothetical protein [Methylibium sp.]MBA3599513.1 hypothetical protein [Methylibium sp.]
MATKTPTVSDVSVVALARSMQKYIVEIPESELEGAVDPVYISNGDYGATLKRGKRVVVPECVISVLRNAIQGVMDPKTRIVREVPSYPFNAEKYDGDMEIGTEVDRDGRPVLA